MSLLNVLSNKFIIATSCDKASDSEIDELRHYSQIDVPDEYLQIIKENTEIEIEVDKQKYMRIWGAAGCLEMNEAYNIQKYIPQSLAIGDDECSNVIIYANGKNGYGIYIVSLSDLDVEEMVYISDSLKSFLVMEKGITLFCSYY